MFQAGNVGLVISLSTSGPSRLRLSKTLVKEIPRDCLEVEGLKTRTEITEISHRESLNTFGIWSIKMFSMSIFCDAKPLMDLVLHYLI